jgi:hypothetical protein
MPDSAPYPDPGAERDRPPIASAPPWVWLLGIPVVGTSLSLLEGMIVPLIVGH